MTYLLNGKIINKFNEIFKLNLDFSDTNFNILIYLYDHEEDWNNLTDLSCYLLIKFLAENDYRMVVDYFCFLCKKSIETEEKPQSLHEKRFKEHMPINFFFNSNDIYSSIKRCEDIKYKKCSLQTTSQRILSEFFNYTK